MPSGRPACRARRPKSYRKVVCSSCLLTCTLFSTTNSGNPLTPREENYRRSHEHIREDQSNNCPVPCKETRRTFERRFAVGAHGLTVQEARHIFHEFGHARIATCVLRRCCFSCHSPDRFRTR